MYVFPEKQAVYLVYFPEKTLKNTFLSLFAAFKCLLASLKLISITVNSKLMYVFHEKHTFYSAYFAEKTLKNAFSSLFAAFKCLLFEINFN